MNPEIATLVYACGVAGLFYLDRDNSVRVSKALWLPVVYIWIVGSRPLSVWLGVSPGAGTNLQLDGSPLDRAFFTVLFVAALGVLVHRGQRVLKLLQYNWPILIYFLYCFASVFWSDFPEVAFKRWIKSIGDLLIILIVLTDQEPVAALRRLFSRTGFLLIPASLLFIKYFPYLGRTYDPWSGLQIYTGVTLNKNILGVITFVLMLGAVWRVLGLLRSDDQSPRRRRHLIAQGALVILGTYLLAITNSDTSTVCFVLGAGLMVVLGMQSIRRHATAVHVIVLLLVITASSVMFLGGEASVAHALGRQATLSGRTEIWAAIIPMAPNPLVGAGFESFWLNPNVAARLAELFPNLPLNEAHNGYIEVYLELGWVGLSLIGLILISGYRRSVEAFRREPVLGCLLVAYTFSAMVYNVTEAGFRMMDPFWIFFLLAVMEASGVARGFNVSDAVTTPTGPYVHSLGGDSVAMGFRGRTTLAKSSGDKRLDLVGTYKRPNPGTRN